MEKKRVMITLMTLFLFLGIAVGEEADIGKATNPTEDVDVGVLRKAIRSKTLVTNCTSQVAKTFSSGSEPLQYLDNPYQLALLLFVSMERCLFARDSNAQPKVTKIETDDASQFFKLPDTPIGGSPVEGGGMPWVPSPPLAPFSVKRIIEVIKFQTMLRTCSHVSAKTCFTTPNVAASLLGDCLIPSMNQCLYPGDESGGSPPIRK